MIESTTHLRTESPNFFDLREAHIFPSDNQEHFLLFDATSERTMSSMSVSDLIKLLDEFPKPDGKDECQQLWASANRFAARIEDEFDLQHRLLAAVRLSTRQIVAYNLITISHRRY